MAQAASKTCEICENDPGSHYCLQCEQYFCEKCKSFHNKQNISKDHMFQSGWDVIPAGKLKCKEHKEDFSFLCKTCNVPVCSSCVTDKHNGHKLSKIFDSNSELKEKNDQELRQKIKDATLSMEKVEQGLSSFDENVDIVIKAITDEGRKLKYMIDKHISQMIESLKDQSKKEKDKLKTIIAQNKGVLRAGVIFNNRSKELFKTKNDENKRQALKNLTDEIVEIKIETIPEFPTVKYETKSSTDNEIRQLFGSFKIR